MSLFPDDVGKPFSGMSLGFAITPTGFHCPCGDPMLDRLEPLFAPCLRRALAGAMSHSEAQYNLALLYSRGDGVKQDAAVAAKWCRRTHSTTLAT